MKNSEKKSQLLGLVVIRNMLKHITKFIVAYFTFIGTENVQKEYEYDTEYLY